MVQVGQQTVLELRNDLFTKLQSLPLKFFDQRPHGETMSRLTNDVENVNQVLSESLIQIISGTLTAIGVIVLMFILQPTLALVAVGSTLLLTFGINRFVGSPHPRGVPRPAEGARR